VQQLLFEKENDKLSANWNNNSNKYFDRNGNATTAIAIEQLQQQQQL